MMVQQLKYREAAWKSVHLDGFQAVSDNAAFSPDILWLKCYKSVAMHEQGSSCNCRGVSAVHCCPAYIVKFNLTASSNKWVADIIRFPLSHFPVTTVTDQY